MKVIYDVGLEYFSTVFTGSLSCCVNGKHHYIIKVYGFLSKYFSLILFSFPPGFFQYLRLFSTTFFNCYRLQLSPVVILISAALTFLMFRRYSFKCVNSYKVVTTKARNLKTKGTLSHSLCKIFCKETSLRFLLSVSILVYLNFQMSIVKQFSVYSIESKL